MVPIQPRGDALWSKPPKTKTRTMSARGCRRASWTEHPFRIGSCLAFIDPSFDPLRRELKAVADAAWDAYSNSRKSPLTKKAGRGFADPNTNSRSIGLPPATPSGRRKQTTTVGRRGILLVNGSSRTEHTCPGEISKTWRLVEIAMEAIEVRVCGGRDRCARPPGKVRQAAIVLVEAVQAKRNGKLIEAGARLREPRPK